MWALLGIDTVGSNLKVDEDMFEHLAEIKPLPGGVFYEGVPCTVRRRCTKGVCLA